MPLLRLRLGRTAAVAALDRALKKNNRKLTLGLILPSKLRSSGVVIGLTSFMSKDPPVVPKLNEARARAVLGKVDEILAWERSTEHQRESRFVELGRYLCEIRAGQYWRLEKFVSFDDFLESRFPESRRKAYYLMSIHEHLPKQIRPQLKQVGWTKATELAKVARSDGKDFDCATWLHKATSL